MRTKKPASIDFVTVFVYLFYEGSDQDGKFGKCIDELFKGVEDIQKSTQHRWGTSGNTGEKNNWRKNAGHVRQLVYIQLDRP